MALTHCPPASSYQAPGDLRPYHTSPADDDLEKPLLYTLAKDVRAFLDVVEPSAARVEGYSLDSRPLAVQSIFKA